MRTLIDHQSSISSQRLMENNVPDHECAIRDSHCFTIHSWKATIHSRKATTGRSTGKCIFTLMYLISVLVKFLSKKDGILERVTCRRVNPSKLRANSTLLEETYETFHFFGSDDIFIFKKKGCDLSRFYHKVLSFFQLAIVLSFAIMSATTESQSSTSSPPSKCYA